MHCPNLFSYATSELSQDAMICWLLSWSDQKSISVDINMHNLGLAFLNSMLEKYERKILSVQKICIFRQLDYIDIVVDINDDISLVIEDKASSGIHSDQLSRYYDRIENDVTRKNKDKFYIYAKTHDFSISSELRESHFKIYDRADFLRVFENFKNIENNIFIDFNNYLQYIQDESDSYKTVPVNEWSWRACQGFYTNLQKNIPDLEWDYVPNASGGFLGCWWNFNKFISSDVYLQIETTFKEDKSVESRLRFKIGEIEHDNPVWVRDLWIKKLEDAAVAENFPIEKPTRLRFGTYMTVKDYGKDCRMTDSQLIIDMEATLQLFDKASKVIARALQ